jgi:hypothetical protein
MPKIGSHRAAARAGAAQMNAALAVIEEHRKNAFKAAFEGTSLTKKGASIKEDAKAIASESKEFVEAVVSAAGVNIPSLPSAEALGVIFKLTGLEPAEKSDFESVFAEELAVFAGKGLLGVASMMTPYLGLVLTGKDMLKEWVLTAMEGHKSLTLKRSIATDILPGDPTAAAQAVREMISREAANHGRLAAISTVKFAVDVSVTAGAFGADVAGPVTGAAAAGAKLANSLFLLGRDYREMKSANALLTATTLPTPARLFGAYPLLGSYLIAGADDSDLLFFFLKDMGSAGWMDKVEQQKKKTLAPLQTEARKLIRNSRFTLNGFHGAKVDVQVAARQSRVAQIKGIVSKLF